LYLQIFYWTTYILIFHFKIYFYHLGWHHPNVYFSITQPYRSSILVFSFIHYNMFWLSISTKMMWMLATQKEGLWTAETCYSV
jgi:hypothetical protein